MGDRIVIRKACANDAPAIAECLASAFASFRSQYTAGAFADTVLTAEGMLERMTHMTIYVAVVGAGEIAGTVACGVVDKIDHLRGMAVQPPWQGHSIAEKLLRAAENDVRAAGCSRITLDTTAPLERAMRFYQRHGYVPTGRITDFFGMPLHEYEKERDLQSLRP